jgi:dephospho-CoA kinase
MLLLGLTGSIATGKSTVSQLLSAPPYNLTIIDADLLSRKVMEPGTKGYDQIISHFGNTISGLVPAIGAPIDREALGRQVFGNEPCRKRDRCVLNGIIHPLVQREIYKLLFRAYFRGCWAVVLDVPLLFEVGMEKICGGVLVVSVTAEMQMQRLLARDKSKGLTEDEAIKRIASQMTVREKQELCKRVFGARGWIINNNAGIPELVQEVERIMVEVKRGRGCIWTFFLWSFPPVAILVGISLIILNWERRNSYEKQKEIKAKM